MRLRHAAYLRVSTTGQDPRLQRDAIRTKAGMRHASIDEWFSEKIGGAARARPELIRLRQAIREGKFDVLWVYRLDRLSRGGIRETLQIVDEIRSNGCRIESVADGFSLSDSTGDIVLAVLAWAAQIEREAIGERIRTARTRVAREGGQWGRARKADATMATKIRGMHPDRSVREIAIAMKIPRSTVHAIVSQKGAYARVKKPTKKTTKNRA